MAPKSIAFFGGKSMVEAVRRCRKSGFQGQVWLVHPNHNEIDGEPCFNSVSDLPGPVDASFIGTNREITLSIVQQLSNADGGGAVCYASGFAETGAVGKQMQDKLIEVSGDMALLGPNCYGMLNYLHSAGLWPVAYGGKQVDKGVAILTQSGNFGYNLSMVNGSLPIAYIASVGNQASVDVVDLINVLLDEPRVTAIGLHIEGLKDIPSFAQAAMRALDKCIPIVVMKIGASVIGSKLAMSHTNSLAGSDDLYNALFDRVGVIRVSGPVSFMETMKILSCGQLPKGSNLAALAVSGGDAGFIADYSETNNLYLPQPDSSQHKLLKNILPKFAHIANPLDFTTAIWGNPDALRSCVETMLRSNVDFGFLVLDYPTEESGERAQCDLMADIFQQTLAKYNIPGAVASAFPELLPKTTRDRLQSYGVPALQGVEDGLAAMGRVVHYSTHRQRILNQYNTNEQKLLAADPVNKKIISMNEWESKQQLSKYGLPVPNAKLVNKDLVIQASKELGCPVAVKIVNSDLQHKTEAGAVTTNIASPEEAAIITAEMIKKMGQSHPRINTDTILVEKMSKPPVAELIVGVKREENFGFALVIGSGGILVELIQDRVILLLPTNKKAIERALAKLKVAKVLNGFRGKPVGDIKQTVLAIMSVADFAIANADNLIELEVNPLMVLDKGVVAVDAYIRMAF